MVKRSYESKFMSGAYVFPGGAVEKDVDSSSAFFTNNNKYNDQMFRVCAVREAFEESGIAMFKNIRNYGELQQWRQKIHHKADEMLHFCKEEQCEPDVDSLIPFAHWITPLQESRRTF